MGAFLFGKILTGGFEMNHTLTKLSVLLVCTSLTACSSNTQDGNTAVGAVTGGVIGGLAGSLIGAGTGQAVAIGVGIVAGALIGGTIGHNMDSSDHAKMNQAMNNRTGHPSSWTNSKTGAHYTVAPTTGAMTIDGHPNCRKFNTTAVINGKQQTVSGVACKQANGTWKAIKS